MRAIQAAEALTEELDRAIRVLGSLYRGRSPRTGESLPPMTEYDDADVVFALGMAVGLLEEARKARGSLSATSEAHRPAPLARDDRHEGASEELLAHRPTKGDPEG